ncbi:phosphoglycerate kinase [Natranaerofaba carboxydovora]|uniref:phosphoglycerate kinase n=1 Tax=Natranaerofaba carboxydovora TaxID=2742683 RepID=UPI001F139654|nr:phosphoglycerate kinase [Natranaerofaba carboxydovora]UMZ72657.1 Phosphoglycerate kinase [Natranaerofaba carboxydovora]
MKKTVKDVDVLGKKVFVRVDFNVPLENRKVVDDSRIKASIPTVKYLAKNGAKTILVTHLGRPKGRVVEDYRVDPVAEKLEELIGMKIKKLDYVDPHYIEEDLEEIQPGEIVMLENVRFLAGEEKCDENLAEGWADLIDIYVNDAFGTAHRAHASTYGVAEKVDGYAGLLMEKELRFFGDLLENPERPFVAILGGAKISDKIGVIECLIRKVDKILIGGGMANTFLAAQGFDLGNSFVEEKVIDTAEDLLKKAEYNGIQMVLPFDLVVTDNLKNGTHRRQAKVGEIEAGEMAVDIGDETVDIFSHIIEDARTVIMNGPMGVFETPPYHEGTVKVAKALADCDGVTVVGGGDSAAAMKKAEVEEKISHISTGGGATLKFLQGSKLPGVEVLSSK